MDYVGSDNSCLGSVWIYSGPIKPQTRIPDSPLVINPAQIILGWGRCGFILDQIWIMFGSGNSGLGSVWIYSGPIWIMLDQIILVWGQYGFILGQ